MDRAWTTKPRRHLIGNGTLPVRTEGNAMNTQSDPLEIWTVYDRPRDYPNCYVARKFVITNGKHGPTGMFMIGVDLDQMRQYLAHMGLTRMDRHPDDEPQIVESWI